MIWGIILVLVGIIVILLGQLQNLGDWFLGTGFVFVISGAILLGAKPSYWRLVDISSQVLLESLKAAQERAKDEPDKAKPSWDIAKIKLEAYIERNFRQVGSIFRLSIVVMLVGFGFILYSTWLALSNSDSVSIAIVGSVAGVVTEFIGATFLFVYRSAMTQALKYTETLERINAVGMAMQILDTISEQGDDEYREKLIDAKIGVAKLLLGNSPYSKQNEEL